MTWVPEAAAPGGDDALDEALAWLASRADFFDRRRPLFVARAPGRIDLMGGIGDYSGALVLETPIAEATWVAAQASDEPTVVVESELAGPSEQRRATWALADIVPARPLDYAQARALFAADPARAWSAYVAGALVVLHRELDRPIRHGLRLLVRSDVPVGAGVSSSAALEVAALEALSPIAGAAANDRDLSLLAQKVENFVVGAPCGVMDQMTATCGRPDHLIEILCQPAEIVGQLPLPRHLELFGINSGIRHAVSGADYGTVRAAAFMGYRMITSAAGIAATPVGPGRVAIDDRLFNGYLANIPPSLFRTRYAAGLPESMAGRDFLDRFQGFTDAVTTIDPDRRYPVRAATAHPIEENERVRLYRALLASGARDRESWLLLGELMFQAHASYAACGLGSDGTDRLVELVREAGPDAGLYGAKITGGGSGGTVAILAARGSRAAIDRIAAQYRAETGRHAHVFAGSSPGSRAYGTRKLIPGSG